MASNLTTLSWLYKKHYKKGIGDAAMQMHPTLKDMRKERFSGDQFLYSVGVGYPQGITFDELDVSALNITASSGYRFSMSPQVGYSVVRLHGPAINAAGSDGALLNILRQEVDGGARSLGEDLGFDLFRAGNGLRGRRASASSDTITLSNAADARNFRIGMELQASANEDGSSARTGSAIVEAIDPSTGTITLDDATGISSFADDDYLFRKGSIGRGLTGMQAIVPLTAPTSGDSFRGVNRSAQVEKLSGARLDDTSVLPEEAASHVANIIMLNGGMADTLVLHPIEYQALANRQNASKFYGNTKDGQVGFEYLVLHVAGGKSLKVKADPDALRTEGRVMTWNDWVIMYQGKSFVHGTDESGQSKVLQVGNTDHAEIRNRVQADVACLNPRGSGVFSIA